MIIGASDGTGPHAGSGGWLGGLVGVNRGCWFVFWHLEQHKSSPWGHFKHSSPQSEAAGTSANRPSWLPLFLSLHITGMPSTGLRMRPRPLTNSAHHSRTPGTAQSLWGGGWARAVGPESTSVQSAHLAGPDVTQSPPSQQPSAQTEATSPWQDTQHKKSTPDHRFSLSVGVVSGEGGLGSRWLGADMGATAEARHMAAT